MLVSPRSVIDINIRISIFQFDNTVINKHNAVDTGRKLNVHKTFRRRPGRLLDILCTFNLRAVSTGEKSLTKI